MLLTQPLLGAVFRRLSKQTRSIHRPKRIISPSSLVHRTHTLFTQLTTQLQGRGIPVSHLSCSAPSIRQSLSLPARIALSRPLRPPCLPRASRLPGNVIQVGLGNARNFSTGQPIFQNLVQNVPVVGRAFYQVDWDLTLRQEKDSKARRPRRKPKLADKLTPLPEPIAGPTSYITEEVQHYFQSPSEPLITTYLQIPLAPTPTSRVPLSSSPSSPCLLPLPALAKEHASHSKHAIRVSSMFRRLDAARVWQRGTTCDTFGDPSGLCTVLRVKFAGWSEEMVRDVLGDAGKDWCTIQELRTIHEVQFEPQYSSVSPMAQATSSNLINEMAYVMPILDFSSSFVAADSPLPSFSDDRFDYSLPSMLTFVGGEESAPPSSWASILSSPRSSDGGFDYSFPSNLDDESVPIISVCTPSLPPSIN